MPCGKVVKNVGVGSLELPTFGLTLFDVDRLTTNG